MRRAYYIYVFRQMTRPVFTHGLVLFISFVALSRTISIPNIWSNMLNVRVGELADFFIGSLLHTRSLVLLLLGVMIFTALSLGWRLFSVRRVSRVSLTTETPGMA